MRRSQSQCLPCNVLRIVTIGALGLMVGETIRRYLSSRAPIGVTLLGQYSASLSDARVESTDTEAADSTSVTEPTDTAGMPGRAGTVSPTGTSPTPDTQQLVAPDCKVSGTQVCDVYEDWVVIDGVRWVTGHHLENCRTEITSVECDGGGRGGGGGGSRIPPNQQCLANSRRQYETGIANCRFVYGAGTVAIVAGGLACTIFSEGIGALPCARAAFGAEAALSAAYVACIANEGRKKADRDHECLQPQGG